MTRWGIWGTSAIAASFARGLSFAEGAVLQAVGSRDAGRAEAFLAATGARRAHVGRAALLGDPEVDVVYIASPNAFHEEDCLAAIAAKKAVLCEKPLSTSVASARRIEAAAEAAGVFVMEAMWTRFFPLIPALEAAIAEVGPLCTIEADFGFAADPVQDVRIFDPAYGAGALLDVGVYPIWLALHFGGPAAEVRGLSVRAQAGVDASAGLVIRHANDRLSTLSCSIVSSTPSRAIFGCARGHLELEPPWWRPEGAILRRDGAAPEALFRAMRGNGYAHEAEEVMRCLGANLTESPKHPLSMTRQILQVVEAVRMPV
ncbi:MAG: Gfo/Idh/MocA family oxidoreductase [Myxococcota bacterium]